MGGACVACQGAWGGLALRDMTNDPEREKRLAEALRANLRRRKAQARDTEEAEAPPREGERQG